MSVNEVEKPLLEKTEPSPPPYTETEEPASKEKPSTDTDQPEPAETEEAEEKKVAPATINKEESILFQIVLEDSQGKKVPVYELADKIVGFYFTAQWVGEPVEIFDPQLVKFAEEHKDEFTVVVISVDKDKETFKAYMKDKPFLAVPYDEPIRERILEEWAIKLIPTLTVYHPLRHEIVTTWGRGAIMKNGKKCLDAWKAGDSGLSWSQLAGFGDWPVIQYTCWALVFLWIYYKFF
ncbi:hypothetical protein K493DRAFT_318361 [Basidiobolus meristosporus CBS 931.73]|uniref:protein-disulfide reductase n=1 Tax=Basidiobolus meristosporus CBS 931.73 TaxID=1314790 RepID=A0A1Y1XVT0_9FUNG|nr:hypothetical protein K493DRAFT_343204 [Basidiobolus meristosporus CBS 931.73]ORX89860.1 hypothetical protein K493DRAFT_318361 [Basidiobolus meristosporus CBS 931.73]|eukprot:ORX68060.1 hypothetical protein K493DRAFT_343204 [Basidiobolus meristosporus CBS 931.73]